MVTRKYSTTEKRIWQEEGFAKWVVDGMVLVIILSFACLVFNVFIEKVSVKPSDFPDLSHEVVEVGEVEVKEISPQEEHALLLREIVYQSVLAGIDPISALKVAKCESRYIETAKSKNSSAKGLYQFIDRTWEGYCSGDPLVAEDSINCFVKLYKRHPEYWACKG